MGWVNDPGLGARRWRNPPLAGPQPWATIVLPPLGHPDMRARNYAAV